MIFRKVQGRALFFIFSFNHNRHFLPFGRADLTTFAIIKLSSRAKRGDLMMIRQRHEIAASLRSSQRRLRCSGPFAVDDHSFMGRALHLRQSRLVNNSGYLQYRGQVLTSDRSGLAQLFFLARKKGDRLLFLEGRGMSLLVDSSYRKSILFLF